MSEYEVRFRKLLPTFSESACWSPVAVLGAHYNDRVKSCCFEIPESHKGIFRDGKAPELVVREMDRLFEASSFSVGCVRPVVNSYVEHLRLSCSIV